MQMGVLMIVGEGTRHSVQEAPEEEDSKSSRRQWKERSERDLEMKHQQGIQSLKEAYKEKQEYIHSC